MIFLLEDLAQNLDIEFNIDIHRTSKRYKETAT